MPIVVRVRSVVLCRAGQLALLLALTCGLAASAGVDLDGNRNNDYVPGTKKGDRAAAWT